MTTTGEQPTADPASPATARATETAALADGQDYDLRIAPVGKMIDGPDPVRMLAYNGSIPGPTLRAHQGSHSTVHIHNDTAEPTTVHWHGLRIDNRYDGTHLTQHPIEPGGSFTAVLDFPDPGLYWYHPHIRTDYGLEMGLAGTIVVDPTDPDYWPAVHRDLVLTLDDVLLTDGQVEAFDRHQPNYVAMGRFGTVLLTNGETNLALTAAPGEVVRLYLVNTANTRVFNVAIPAAQVKLVGGDSGHVEQERFVDSVLLAPSERAVVDVLFDQPGEQLLEHLTPDRTYTLARINVEGPHAQPPLDKVFRSLRTNADLVADRERITPYLSLPPDKTLSFLAEMSLPEPEGSTYTCPMHPDVISDIPGHCPQCGMKLIAVATVATYVCPMHPEVTSDQPGSCHRCGMKLVASSLISAGAHDHHDMAGHDMAGHDMAGHDMAGHDMAKAQPGELHEHGQPGADGIEWEDDMVEVNRITTPENMRWKLVDAATGAENTDIDWSFRVGDQVKIRLVNEMAGDHPMHHPFHVHGAGRFLVLARDGKDELNLVWKDTVLVRTGETVDILLDVTHPGAWMAHCHIAEHHEANMMFNFNVMA